ncbi:MaoC/PaaZ C-terminal domain-containing protein [Actinotalea sp.]|uniref:MaoC/PaaZ C-terminal domain-containing protein n=1 Tax=Actinotalea sp. TaxID=1872145 RepID=UPI0035634888
MSADAAETWSQHPDLEDVDTVELATVPGLGGLYARGVAGAARSAASRRTTVDPAGLPATHLVVREVRADADRLTAYQHLVGEPGTDVLPAGFVHVMAFPVATALMVREDFPLPLLGMVHLANRVEQRRPILLGEELDVVVHAERLVPHRAGVSVDLVVDVTVGPEVVWHGVSTYLAGGARIAGAERPEREPKPEWTPPTPTGQWRLSPHDARLYAAVSGDRNPIHSSRLGARMFGFPRTIAHGMHTAARGLADVGALRGGAFTWAVRFASPVLLPGSVQTAITRDERGFTVEGWSARSGKRNLTVRVEPRS